MKHLLCSYLCVSLICSPIIANAQEPTEGAACEKPIPVQTPCSGVLLPPEAAAEGLRCLTVDIPKLKLELDYNKKLYESREKRLQSLLDLEQQRADKLYELHQKSLELEEDKWYEHPAFWFGIGFVVATGTTVGITYAVNNPGR